MENNITMLLNNIALYGTDGNIFNAASVKGKRIILYFYPKDNTPACTNEALLFQDNLEEFISLNAVVIGVSRDSIESHHKFKDKYELNFLLLSDKDETACNSFEVLKEKNMYGRKSIGIERSTFLFDEEGTLIKEYRKVKVQNHVAEVLAFLKSL